MAPIDGKVDGTGPAAQARAILTELWAWYGRGVPEFDPMLDSVARARLRDVLDGVEVPAERQLRASVAAVAVACWLWP